MRVTKHAQERITERGITQGELIKTLKECPRYINKHDDTKWTFINKVDNVYCVVSKDMSTLITVFRKEQ